MRDLIIRLFAFDYYVRIFGKTISFPRAANIIVPLMLLSAVNISLDPDYPNFDVYDAIYLIITVVVMLIPFVYLKLKPVYWEELTHLQKYMYGSAALSLPFGRLPKEHLDEYLSISKNTIDVIERKKFYKVYLLLINPVAIVLTVLYILFYH